MLIALEKWCYKYDTWDHEYNHFQEFNEINPLLHPEGYLVRIPFYVLGKKHAHVLLSTSAHPDLAKDSLYEIGE